MALRVVPSPRIRCLDLLSWFSWSEEIGDGGPQVELFALTTWQAVGGSDRNVPCPAVAALPPVEENDLLDINLNTKVDGKPRIVTNPWPFGIWRRRVTCVAEVVARVAGVRSASFYTVGKIARKNLATGSRIFSCYPSGHIDSRKLVCYL